MKRLTKRELQIGALFFPPGEALPARPTTRGECCEGFRPCPFVACRWHLYIDVSERTGAITYNFPDIEVEEMGESCALDVADRGGTTLEDAGAVMNLTRERIRQVELRALARMARAGAAARLREYSDEGEHGRRRLPVLEDR